MLLFKTNGAHSFQYLSCGRFISDHPFLHSARQLDNFVILFGISGEMSIVCDDQEFTLKPGSMLLLPPGLRHSGARPSTPQLSYCWCHFICQDEYQLLDSESLEINALFDHRQFSGIVLPMYGEVGAVDRPMLIFQQMMHIAYTQYRYCNAADYALSLLAAELSEQCWQPSQLLKHNPAKLNEITEWIRINLTKPLTVQSIAAKFGYSADYLSSMFRRHMDVNIVKYIRNMRINRAKELLLNTQKQVQEIACEIGYTDEKYFMRQFKAVENMTPSDFRNAYSQKHMNNQ
ncbi:MAG: AraC family transcriptional regulator [Eubacteriales bacterium]|nr:AraC family transcriptional regulator [Eubacteriales bacterium]